MDNNDEKIDIMSFQDEEEIEFDDNINIDELQKNLQEHMKSSDIVYIPEETEEIEEVNNVDEMESTLTENVDEVIKDLGIDENKKEELVTVSEENSVENLPEILNEVEQKPLTRAEKLKLRPGEKKYIVYIEPDNVEFIENLSIAERKEVINRILKEEDITVRRRRERAERIKFTNQVIIMLLTVVISLPIFFVILNKSIEATIFNYQQTQQNFVKLYKEQGKIKSYKNFQKHFQ